MDLTKYSKALLRIGVALVFLYFGFQMILHPDRWSSYVPEFLTGILFTANNWAIANGVFEITLGLFLILGLYTRFASLLLSVHLLFITIAMGFTPIGARDFGLTVATFVVFLNGIDCYTLDHQFLKKKRK